MDDLRRQHISEGRIRGTKSRLKERREIFWSKVLKTEKCWVWLGGLASNGYGQFYYDGQEWFAHRLAYFLCKGPLTKGLTVDHLCRVRSCVNPEHLEEVSLRENVLRGTSLVALNMLKTHCKAGHEFTVENTRMYRGQRMCRSCERERSQLRRNAVT